MLGHIGFRRLWRHHRGLLAVVGTVLALTGIVVALAPPPSSQAAQGMKWLVGVPYAGALTTNGAQRCSVTVVSEWLAITAKHCGTVNPKLQLDISARSTPGVYQVKSITPNETLDVEAIYLRNRTGLTVTPLRASFAQERFSAWGYGADRSNNSTGNLTRADFDLPHLCPVNLSTIGGSLCWPTTATNSVCTGDSGGPVTQNGAIIGMVTRGVETRTKPDGNPDCSTGYVGQALTVKDMQPWLNQMIKDADPFD